ncbi:hypothetical protein DYB32_000344 [Aphanomyces invadans]|uniref:Uncharacterized protein n=1 Tax=Aphanomyces invadans TaxID=157072 RepID=A0A418BAF6_9STRA|nr:hypothetical protein DYB32_000344 [Aphanomyces invadans]
MELDIVRPTVVDRSTPIAWTIRSTYGDPIVLVKSAISVCDTSKYTCTYGSADFVAAPSSAIAFENATFAKGATTVTFPTSSSYVVALNVVAGSNGQQFLATLPVSVVLESSSLPSIAPPTTPGTTPSSTISQDDRSKTPSNGSVILIIVGAILALVLGTVFAMLFAKLRKARANISSQQSSLGTYHPDDASHVELDTAAAAKFVPPEPYSRRVYVANSSDRGSSVAGGPSSSDGMSALQTNFRYPSASGARNSTSETCYGGYVQVTDQVAPQRARRPLNYRR